MTISHRTILLVNAAVLALVGGVTAVLAISSPGAGGALLWLAVGLVGSEVLLGAMLRLSPTPRRLADLTRVIGDILDVQAGALLEQESQIAGLTAALKDETMLDEVRDTLVEETTPRLETLVKRLEQTEQSLPEEVLPMTRAWIARMRRQATLTQAHVQALSDEALYCGKGGK